MNFKAFIALFTAAVFLTCNPFIFAQAFLDDDSKNNIDPTSPLVTAMKVAIPPVLDGEILNDTVWEAAKPVTGFWQTTPDQGQAASEKTEVRIIYTNRILYFGVVCYDREPQRIIVSDSRRDASLEETDSFQLILDTYHDKQNGFLFGTNPAGIEYDAQVTNEGQGRFGGGRQRRGAVSGFNLNWDASWEVKTKISEIGWSAEFAIPFKTLRFSKKDSQTWGVNFQRNIRRRNEQSYWVKLDRQYNIQKISLAGTLSGLENIRQNNLKIIPYTLGQASRNFQNPLEQETQRDLDAGIDLKYSVTPGLTLDATYNTDFAQVEVDEQQINLGRFNLFFPEKRPFFLENAGFFSVGSPGEVELFFSRRIGIASGGFPVPILAGGRLSGKAAGLNVGLLNMQTESFVGQIVDGGTVEFDSVQSNNFTVVRINKELPNRSAIGALFVNRQGSGRYSEGDDYNRTFALDGRWGIGKYGQLSGFAAQTATPDVEEDEYAFRFAAQYNSEAWILLAGYTQVSEAFNPEVGFLQRSGFRKPNFTIFNTTRPKDFLGLLEMRPHVSYQGFWDFDGFQESGRWHIDNHLEWKNGYEFHTAVNLTKEGIHPLEIEPVIIDGMTVGLDTVNAVEIQDVFIPPGTYDHAEVALVGITNRGAWISFSMRATIGGYFGGDRIFLSPSARFRIGEAFNAELSLRHNNIDLPNGSFVTNLLRARISYSFTPRLFLQGLVQYNDSADIWSSNFRLGWLQSANTGLFVVYNDVREHENRMWGTRSRSLIVKYSQLFDLLN